MTVLTDTQKTQITTHIIAKIILANLCLILLGLVKIPLPFSPVPIVLQLQGCLMLPLLIGSRGAFCAISLLIMEGFFGLPVMATQKIGLALITGPTAGYVAGYLASTFFISKIFNALKVKTGHAALLAMAFGNLLVYFLGATWLSHFVGVKGALLVGVAPFVLFDLVKLMLISRLFKRFLPS